MLKYGEQENQNGNSYGLKTWQMPVFLLWKTEILKILIQKGCKREIRNTHINIGTGKEISIKELAETIRSIIGFKGDLVFNSDKPDGTMRKLTDVSKLNDLGWKHTVELEEGIKKIYDWYVDKQ